MRKMIVKLLNNKYMHYVEQNESSRPDKNRIKNREREREREREWRSQIACPYVRVSCG
jgi:hypothetical protein